MLERYKIAPSLDLKKEERKVSSLIYSMEKEAEDILESFGLSDAELRSYGTVRDKFESFFCEEENIVLSG